MHESNAKEIIQIVYSVMKLKKKMNFWDQAVKNLRVKMRNEEHNSVIFFDMR